MAPRWSGLLQGLLLLAGSLLGGCPDFPAALLEPPLDLGRDSSGDAPGVQEGGADSDGQLRDALQDAFDPCPHPKVRRDCRDGWCVVSPGCFRMGSPPDEPCRQPDEARREVTLSHGALVAETEVVQERFALLMGYNPSVAPECDGCPVEQVSWHEAASYCNLLSQAESLPPCYKCSGNQEDTDCQSEYPGGSIYRCPGYRLPTEAEWEMATRAGTQTAFFNGSFLGICYGADSNADKIAWYEENSGGRPQPVGGKRFNGWGLSDTSGNVNEWVHDWYEAERDELVVVDPWGPPGGDARVVRGGGYAGRAGLQRSASRQSAHPLERRAGLGFRCLRSLYP